MHRSRLVALVIDCKGDDLDLATDFWSRALGRPPAEKDGRYVTLQDRPGETIVLLQSVSHPSRVHLDIETDDIPAEVARLEALGAKRVDQVHTWHVLEAPTGHRFCVVRPQRGALERANIWDQGTPAPVDAPREASLQDTLQQLTLAWRHKQYADLEPLFEEGVIFVAPDGHRITGRTACIESYRSFVEAVEINAYAEHDVTIDRPNPSIAMATVSWTMTWTRDGSRHEESGKDLFTLSHRGGRWRILWRTMLPS